MDRSLGSRSPRAATALRSQEVPTARERAEESPTSEYNTPLASPSGHDFSGQESHFDPPLPARTPPPPSKSPRLHDPINFQTSQTQKTQGPLRRTPRSEEDVTRSGSASSGTNHGIQTSQPQRSQHPASFSATSRQGSLAPPSSPYPPRAIISPILEETSEPNVKSRNSVASSKVVPSSWGSHPDDYNFDRVKEKFGEGQDGPHSPASPESTVSMHDDTTGLVRQASLGKKMKPSLTRIRNSGRSESLRKSATDRNAMAADRAADLLGAGPFRKAPAANVGPTAEVGGNRTILIDNSASNSRSSSPGSSKDSLNTMELIGRSRSPLASASDRSARQPTRLAAGIDQPSLMEPVATEKGPPRRRPPRLDMEAVRDAEARGSMTSLPDLIRRATKLAANLDRGKTASRAGMYDLNDVDRKEQRRRSGSISDILASFPPPSRGTPDGMRFDPRWPSRFSPSKLNQRVSHTISQQSSSSSRPPRRGRRCCGIPAWAFVLVVLLLLALIAAAIALPVVLIVLPRQRQAAANEGLPSGLSDCSDSISCENNGVAVSNGNACRCICIDGFTGDRCSTAGGPGCNLVDLDEGSGRLDSATVGSALPPLFGSASEDYNIPLDRPTILSLFSSSSLSCPGENALVKLNGRSIRVRQAVPHPAAEEFIVHNPIPTIFIPSSPNYTSRPLMRPRQVATSDGIVFQISTATEASPTSSAPSVSTPSASGPASSNSSPSNEEPTPETLTFARLAILFVFEQTGQLRTAVNAQDSIEEFVFDTERDEDLLSLGSDGGDVGLDFSAFAIVLGNGTEVGGRGDGRGGLRRTG